MSVVFVAAMVIAAPMPASAACFSISEARQHFGSVHLYWHGSDHCWDASPGRRRDAATTPRHARKHERREAERPKWREARSELAADNEPTRAPESTGDQRVATPDAPPIRIAPVKLVSFLSDWTERWVDIDQVVPDHSAKAQSSLLAASAPEQKVDLVLVLHGLALFTFGFGLVLTFIALVKRSGPSSIGPPSMDGASRAVRGFGAGPIDEGSHPPRIDRDDSGANLQSPTAALTAFPPPRGRWFGTVRHLVLVLISRQANFICLKALRWGRQIDRFVSHGAYPTEVKWPPHSAGAMISSEDVSRPFTLPSRLLEETRQAAARAAPLLTPRTGTRGD
jgi:hypothetical protein